MHDTDSKPSPKRGGFAALVAAGILLSRISGLLREKVFAHYLGNSPAAGVFRAAFRIPNMLQNLFGEGVLSASFIPVYARLRAEHDEAVAGRVAGAVATLLALVTALIVLVGVLFTPALLFLIVPGLTGADRALAITTVRILFPGVGVLVMGAWCQGILNSHRRFFLSYVAPVLMNLAMIAGLVAFGGRVGQDSLVVTLAWATLIGAFLQFGVQLPTVLRHERHLALVLDLGLDPLRQVVKNFVPVVFGRGVVQFSAYLDNWLASFLGTAALAGLGYAQMLYTLPVSLFGMSVAAAELPQMSSATGSEAEIAAALRERLAKGLRQIAFFVIPSVAAFLVLGRPLVAALFQGGRFRAEDTQFVWYILIGSTVGLLAATLGRLYASTFYALNQAKTPLRFAMLRVGLTGALGYLFALPLRPLMLSGMAALHIPLPLIGGGTAAYGAIGLTASAGLAGWLEFLLLRRALHRRIGDIHLPGTHLARLWAASGLSALLALAFTTWILPPLSTHLPRFQAHLRDGLLVLGCFGLLYLGATLALGVPEAKSLLARLRRR